MDSNSNTLEMLQNNKVKGKGKEVIEDFQLGDEEEEDDEEEGNDTIEEEEEESDIEVEGLLQRVGGKLEPDNLNLPEIDIVPPQRQERSNSSGSNGNTNDKYSKSTIRMIMKRFGMVTMTGVETKILRKEMLTQTLPILLLSLLGSQLTGLVLERLQGWRVFIRIEELFILVPILLNLKGNLEMNLAARFSTSANIGELDLRLTRRSLILGNLALLQVQALLVSLLSGLLAFVLGMLSRNGVKHGLQHPIHNPTSVLNNAAGGSGVTDALRGGYFEVLLVLCVSGMAASLSSAVLGSFMCSLVVLCRRFKINPDNIATPLASALGDLLTLIILGLLSSVFAHFMGTLISTVVFFLLLGAIGWNVLMTIKNAYVQELLTTGWGPLLLAMVISSGSGLILESYVNEFQGFALFAPVVTSLAGNAGSIFVSRISTSLHSSRKEHYLIVSATLFFVTTPILLFFLVFAWITGQIALTFTFAVAYVVVVCLEMILSLSLAYTLATLLWKWDYDPDVYALPLLSSFLDLAGQLMLVGAFSLARKFAPVSTSIIEGLTTGLEVASDGLY